MQSNPSKTERQVAKDDGVRGQIVEPHLPLAAATQDVENTTETFVEIDFDLRSKLFWFGTQGFIFLSCT